MVAGSARSRDELLDDVEATIDKASSERLGEELFAVVGLLDHEPALRRGLTEPSVPAAAKEQVLDSVLGGKIGRPALDVLKVAVAKRWSISSDLTDAVEQVAIVATAASAEEAGKLDDVESELFRFARILDAEPQLREALSDPAPSLEGKRSLLNDVLGRKVGKVTKDLLVQLVAGRHRSLTRGLLHYQQVLAARHQRLLATAWVATELSEAHQRRLARALGAMYDKPVHLNVVVDPDVLGGVRIKIGDDLIDSSIETRLADAQRQLIG